MVLWDRDRLFSDQGFDSVTQVFKQLTWGISKETHEVFGVMVLSEIVSWGYNIRVLGPCFGEEVELPK